MEKAKKITVRGKQRADIDPTQLVQIILAIAAQDDGRPDAPTPDTHASAVVDRFDEQTERPA